MFKNFLKKLKKRSTIIKKPLVEYNTVTEVNF